MKDDRKYQRALPELDLADITLPEQMDIEEATPRQLDPEENGTAEDQTSHNGDNSEDAAGEVDDDMASTHVIVTLRCLRATPRNVTCIISALIMI